MQSVKKELGKRILPWLLVASIIAAAGAVVDLSVAAKAAPVQAGVSVPQGAIPLPLTEVAYQAAVLAGIQQSVEHHNAQAELNYKLACDNWLVNNQQRRDLDLPLTPKPVQPASHVVRNIDGQDGTIWVWTESGELLGDPCPDLPPLPEAPPEGQVRIGQHVHGSFYQCLGADTMPAGATVVVPPADAPEPGTYRKHVTPFGALWEKVN